MENRQRQITEAIHCSYTTKYDDKANILVSERSELRRVISIITKSELALLQMIIRLATVGEISEAINHINNSVKVIKDVSKSVSGSLPNLENYAYGVGPTLNEALIDLQNIIPSINHDLNSDESSKIIEQALRFAQEELAKNHLESVTPLRKENGKIIAGDKTYDYYADTKIISSSGIGNHHNQNNKIFFEFENVDKIGIGSSLEEDTKLPPIQKKNKLVDY